MTLEHQQRIAKRYVQLERQRIKSPDQHRDCYEDKEVDGRCPMCWSMDNAYRWVRKQPNAIELFDWAYDHVDAREEADACGI
jgi:hypothetical protein